MDDYSGDIFTTGLINIGGEAVYGMLEVADDEDWFRVVLNRYYKYQFVFEHGDQSETLTDYVQFNFRDSAGLFLRFGSVRMPETNTFLAEDYSGVYFLQFGSRSRRLTDQVGAYRISAILVDDYTSSIAEAGSTERYFFRRGDFGYGAIEVVGDADWFFVPFWSDTTYTIRVRGTDELTAISDPFLRLLDRDGNEIASDDNSGPGKDALLTFKPDVTNFYYVEVSGSEGATGTYEIEIPEMDDYSSDINTTGRWNIENTLNGVTHSNFDSDWFKTTLQDHVTYQINLPSRYNVSIYDDQGNFLTSPQKAFDRVSFQARLSNSNEYFVAVFNNSSQYTQRIPYQLTAEIIDDAIDSFGVGAKFFVDQVIFGNIEEEGDADVFQKFLLNDVRYAVRVIGDNNGFQTTLEDAKVTVFDSEGNVVASDEDSGPGNNPRAVFVTTSRDNYYFQVESQDKGVGTYRVDIVPLRDRAHDETTQHMMKFQNKIARTVGRWELSDDNDWIEIELEAGKWYSIVSSYENMNSGPFQKGIFDLIDPFGNTAINDSISSYFKVQKTGKHYLATGGDFVKEADNVDYYNFEVREDDVPDLIFPVSIISDDLTKIGLKLTNTKKNPDISIPGVPFYRRVEIYSEVPLKTGAKQIASNTYTTLEFNEWRHLQAADGFRGVGSLFVRFQVDPEDLNSEWSNWASVSIVGTQVPGSIAPIEEKLIGRITFAFASDLPSYFEDDDRVNNHRALSEESRTAVRKALDLYDRYFFNADGSNDHHFQFIETQPNASNDNADLMIFGSTEINSISTPIHGFGLGTGAGSDIVFDMDNPLVNDLSDGSEGFFELLRAVGFSLGMRANESLSRVQSIMGRKSDPGTKDLPFNSAPTPLDYLALQGESPSFVRANAGHTLYKFDEPITTTIVDPTNSGNDTLDVSNSSSRWVIDLRPGRLSYNFEDNANRSTIMMAYHSEVENVTGQALRDQITGNHLNNRISSGDGNDFLDGREGNDILIGGRHDDVYLIRPGYGDDIITEQKLGGYDRLVIDGVGGLDRLREDLSFEKIGNDLKVNLSVDSIDWNPKGGSVIIRNQGAVSGRIETLLLRDQGNQFARISLDSLWSQIVEGGLQRFSVVPNQSDQFGSIVAPV